MNLKIRFALGLAGFTEADVAEIEAALPAMERLLGSVQGLEPMLTKLYPDLVAVIPAAKVILAYVQKEQ